MRRCFSEFEALRSDVRIIIRYNANPGSDALLSLSLLAFSEAEYAGKEITDSPANGGYSLPEIRQAGNTAHIEAEKIRNSNRNSNNYTYSKSYWPSCAKSKTAE